MNYYGSRQKIRGLKRRIKQIQQWKESQIAALDLDFLYNHPPGYEYFYTKLWIQPWHMSSRNPPLWYRRLIFGAMLEVYESWRRTLLDGGRPFYLKIWLYDPHFIESQIVAAVGERIDRYENLFIPDTLAKSFPYNLYKNQNFDLRDYRWESYADEEAYFESGMETPMEINELRKKAWRVITCSGDSCTDEPTYMIRKGSIWLGECRSGL
jgi:hypothetical protein